jgi:hypothetical protein
MKDLAWAWETFGPNASFDFGPTAIADKQRCV